MAKDPKNLTADDKRWIVSYISEQRRRAEDATQSFRSEWEKLWKAYQNKQDYSGKADWQSRCFIPKVWMKIERAAGEIKRAMLQTRKLFKLEVVDDEERAGISQAKRALMQERDPEAMARISQEIQQLGRRIKMREEIRDVEQDRFADSLAETNLVPVYSEMIKAAFLLGIGIPKVTWDHENNRATFQHVNALNVRIDPEYEASSDRPPRYIIEDFERTHLELLREAKAVNAAIKKGGDKFPKYDIAAIKEIHSDSADIEQKDKERRQKGLDHIEPRKGAVDLWQYWGDIPAQDGQHMLLENCMVLVANGSTVILAGKNPFKHGKPPYILTMPIDYPHRGQCGASLAAPVLKLNYTYNNLWNLIVDNLNLCINKQLAYNPQHLLDPKNVTASYPGKHWRHNQQPGANVVQEVYTQGLVQDAWRLIELIRQDIEEAMSVTRMLQGSWDSSSRTATEVTAKLGQAQGFFDIIAWDIEQTSLKPLLEMTYDLYVQFAGYPPREDNYRIVVGGISLMLRIQDMIQRIQDTLGIIANIPTLADRTDVPYLWQRLLDLQQLMDAYRDPQQGAVELTPEQKDALASKAEIDAANDVARYMAEQGQAAQPIGVPT